MRLVQQRRTITGPRVRDAEAGLDHLLARGASLPVALRAVADETAMTVAEAIICPGRDPARELALADLAVALRDEAGLLETRECY
ncbi:hypothetical protein [Cellulomonas sp.]|uniref:hypothetical protein n=1 Tax=Cellulomonas sp. TaxID=40001 RepID=UPI0025896A3E|nr:hypothetical protein [Cellulomonas sp.]